MGRPTPARAGWKPKKRPLQFARGLKRARICPSRQARQLSCALTLRWPAPEHPVHMPRSGVATEVAEARSQLESYVARKAWLAREALPSWDSYTFQYQGQELHGKKVILVNAFCSAPPPDATAQLVRAFDGGPCFFQAYWDPIDKIYVGVAFNGHA